MTHELYSVRMRASRSGAHISGAERIVARDRIDQVAAELRTRAMSRNPTPDKVVVTVESLDAGAILRFRSLDVVSHQRLYLESARKAARQELERSGVSAHAVLTAMTLLDRGAAAGSNMRGAIIMNALSGERLEPDRERGIRVSHFDWTDEASRDADRLLSASGLGHFRTKEALALATKVAHAPGMLAELCWSDDPEYTAGYITSKSGGYIRFPALKPPGRRLGGRVFFVSSEGFDLDACKRYLEKQPVLISEMGSIQIVDAKG